VYGWYSENSVLLEDPGVIYDPAFNRNPAFIWDPAFNRSFTVSVHHCCRVDVRKYFFRKFLAKTRNRLPSTEKDIVNQFKYSIECMDLSS